MEVIYCFTVAIGLPWDASDYKEDKRWAVATYTKQDGVERGNSES